MHVAITHVERVVGELGVRLSLQGNAGKHLRVAPDLNAQEQLSPVEELGRKSCDAPQLDCKEAALNGDARLQLGPERRTAALLRVEAEA